MRFRILGPLEVGGAGGPGPDSGGSRNLTPRAAKIRVVLAALLVRANEIVSVDTLIDELWGEEPPRTATTTLQVYVSQLRKLLDEADAEYGRDALVTRAPATNCGWTPRSWTSPSSRSCTSAGRSGWSSASTRPLRGFSARPWRCGAARCFRTPRTVRCWTVRRYG
ncbi:helix-turn-helix domain-containing protein [Streptomyces drozdowiczii]|uniref:Helix-turn-helix domain-containing protein n=1 Tax=Streptomyces drozdowiczii TaxID=202862 RepID=A0ABY6Q1S2_9ACTN|nr:helix-turn-helix domain-containing protein [Streptomyces drozdowiczii]